MSHPWRALLILGFLLALWQPAAAFNIRGRTVNGVARVFVADVARYYGLRQLETGKSLVLYSDIRRVDLTLNLREARINLLTVHLFYAPIFDDSQWLLAERDLALVIDPIFRSWALGSLPIRRICLDPGHGGQDQGTRGVRLLEKHLTLEIAQRVKLLLEGQGYEVMMTRTDDTFIPLPERADKAIDWQADLFVSIHFNAAATTTVSGIETFIATPVGGAATYKTEAETKPVPGNRFNALNTRLGFEMQRYLIARTGANDRGVKHFRWLVLAQAGMPAVLLELGFLSNPAEERLLGDPNHQHSLALGIASGVIAMDRALNPPAQP